MKISFLLQAGGCHNRDYKIYCCKQTHLKKYNIETLLQYKIKVFIFGQNKSFVLVFTI